MGQKDALPRDEMVEYVLECWDDEAGQSYRFTLASLLYPGEDLVFSFRVE
jgi:hypothetical protein